MDTCTLPTTVNYHFTSACNMRCKFCFSTFAECKEKELSLVEQKLIIQAIANEPVPNWSKSTRRINFVGGEPTIHKSLDDLIYEADHSKLHASMVTNGLNLTKYGVPDSFKLLKLIGFSIDSLSPITNQLIGRAAKSTAILQSQWIELFSAITAIGVSIKINTVVSQLNLHEDLSSFILAVAPRRWKIFQAMQVLGQNSESAGTWAIDTTAFGQFIDRHHQKGLTPIIEGTSKMRGSYAMISPDGRFYDSAQGWHNYSDPILKVGVQQAWNQINFNTNLYKERTSSYCGEVYGNE